MSNFEGEAGGGGAEKSWEMSSPPPPIESGGGQTFFLIFSRNLILKDILKLREHKIFSAARPNRNFYHNFPLKGP